MPELSSIINGKKFMWDGITYESEKDAQEAKKTFEAEGFEVELLYKDNQSLIYTRRVVTEIVVEG
ncbi:MAG: hypothetical protein MUP98_05160 [Candidatus Aminicenantes bacterium]|nr:hypothetical protein [Candidatus Aminicenantes bacterium]